MPFMLRAQIAAAPSDLSTGHADEIAKSKRIALSTTTWHNQSTVEGYASANGPLLQSFPRGAADDGESLAPKDIIVLEGHGTAGIACGPGRKRANKSNDSVSRHEEGINKKTKERRDQGSGSDEAARSPAPAATGRDQGSGSDEAARHPAPAATALSRRANGGSGSYVSEPLACYRNILLSHIPGKPFHSELQFPYEPKGQTTAFTTLNVLAEGAMRTDDSSCALDAFNAGVGEPRLTRESVGVLSGPVNFVNPGVLAAIQRHASDRASFQLTKSTVSPGWAPSTVCAHQQV